MVPWYFCVLFAAVGLAVGLMSGLWIMAPGQIEDRDEDCGDSGVWPEHRSYDEFYGVTHELE
jgi:hypothetical protein